MLRHEGHGVTSGRIHTLHSYTPTNIHTFILPHTPTQSHQKDSRATARLKATGSSLITSSGTAFKRLVARYAKDRCPAAVLVDGGRSRLSCLVARSLSRASA